MKKLIVMVALLISLASTAFASNGFTQKFYQFSTRDTDIIKEVNYYLEKGGNVKFMNSTARSVGDGVIVTMILEIPDQVYTSEKYQKQK